MYPLNPFQPVIGIVNDLRRDPDAGMTISRSLVNAVREGHADAVIRLALAHCIWRDVRIGHEVMADMVEVMLAARGAQEPF